ncbi:MAG: glycoside hydrolase family 3 protein [Chlorobiaceae bacterium]|nr:glycoside hydrolase family 3 protein [Chlorobiaceae bacterium]
MRPCHKPFIALLLLSLFAAWPHPAIAKGAASPETGYRKNYSVQSVFSNRDPWIERTLRNMTVREKVGQMIVAKVEGRYGSTDHPEYRLVSRLATEGKIGGIMFLKGDVESAAMLTNHFQSLAAVPLLVSADMERGLAMRLDGATKFSAAMAVSAAGDPELARRMGEIIAREARAVGIMHNYAPTVDLNINPANPIINTRSFGDRIPLVNTMSAAFIDGMQSGGLVATAKHFPGHGDVTVDSHKALPVLEGDRKRLERYELQPFRAAISQGVLSVMVGHLAVPKLTGSLEPASLSRTIVTGLLRDELNFKGLIVTDALNMKALENGLTPGQVAVKAVEAGNDILLFPEDPEQVFDAVCAAVESGRISERRIETSARRILQLKHWLGLDRQKLVDTSRLHELVGSPEGERIAKRLAEESLTLVRNRENALPLRLPEKAEVLNIILNDQPGESIGRSFAEKLGKEYKVTSVRLTPASTAETFRKASMLLSKADAVVLTTGIQAWSSSMPSKLTDLQRDFVRSLPAMLPKGAPVIFVSFGTPYIFDAFPGIGTALCAYSSNDYSEAAIIRALKGEFIPKGKLPVSLEKPEP